MIRELLLDNEMQVMQRVRYNFWQVLADVGGFHDGLTILVSMVIRPIAATFFVNSLIKGSQQDPPLSNKQKRRRIELISNLQG